jgi:hypothetical protein
MNHFRRKLRIFKHVCKYRFDIFLVPKNPRILSAIVR